MSGSIRPGARPGTWELRISTGKDPLTGKYGSISKTFHGTKKDAGKALAKMTVEMAEGNRPAKGGYTVGNVLDEWMDRTAPDRSPTTIARAESMIRCHIRPALGTRPLRKLDPYDLDQFYRAMRASGQSTASVRRAHAILHAAFGQAVRWGWLSTNPATKASPPRLVAREMPLPTREDVATVLTAAAEQSPRFALALWLAAVTGARRGELTALRWSDLDTDAGTLRIVRTVVPSPAGPVIKDTKTHQERRLALDEATVAVLLDYRAQVEQEAASCEVRLDPDAYMFSSDPEGRTHMNPWWLSNALERLIGRLGVAHFTMHGFRHWMATQAISAGGDIRTVSGRLGHRDASVTLRIYARFLDVADRGIANTMGSLMPPNAKKPPALPELVG